MTVDIRIGGSRELLKAMADHSVHCCVTSPPYFGLRDYGVDGQMGLEATHDVDRIIEFDSNPGGDVYDPFGGLMTVPLRAIKKGRKGWGTELNPGYFADGVRILRAAERELAIPSLFDFLEAEQRDAA